MAAPHDTVPPERVDVLVAGSGAAGLTTALACAVAGLRTAVCETAPRLGGTSALSGGRIWLPGNHFQPDPTADRRAAGAYLADVFGRSAHLEAFLDAAPSLPGFVEKHTAHRFAQCPSYPDYLLDRPGATLGGRCLDMHPLSLAGLHPMVERVAVPDGYVPMTHAEWESWRLPARYDHDLLARRRSERIVTGGVALVSALLDGVLRAGVTVHTGHRVVGVEPGSRAVLDHDIVVDAAVVVLATGGYDQDPELRATLLPPGLRASASAPGNRGDGLRIGRELGAADANLGQGWWMPMVAVPGETVPRSLIRERGMPRQIVVDRTGNRFVDEAVPYHEFGRAMLARDGKAFLVGDAGHRARYPLPVIAPGEPLPDWVATAPTLPDLAVRLGIDPHGLCAQVRRWNASCANGIDDEFGRGGNPYDRYHGDPEQPGNPNLGPLDRPPYFGIPVLAGTIGSKGGPVTDTCGRVLTTTGDPVPGLYAVGNTAAFWTGAGYPGPGATLGVGMTMAMLAGQAIAG